MLIKYYILFYILQTVKASDCTNVGKDLTAGNDRNDHTREKDQRSRDTGETQRATIRTEHTRKENGRCTYFDG